MKYKRIFLIVLDSLGVGALEDAAGYGDENTNTLGHISFAANGLYLPILEKLGIGNITEVKGVKAIKKPGAYITKAREASAGKDTMTGHWEMMGIKTDIPLKTFTEKGFPKELIFELEEQTGRKFIGNISSSGTEIIENLGKRHEDTGELILYTSADSVMQIAAHENIVKPEELYEICKTARKIALKDEWKVGRIIARPFVGEEGNYIRTSGRHDYALNPPESTVLNRLKDEGYDVIGIGKINDIFSGEGITESHPTKSNKEGMEIITELTERDFTGLAFLNLVDFDMLYGHRRDALGYARALEEFDERLGALIKMINKSDMLIITADHGNDPTHTGSDHTREYVPVLIYSYGFTKPHKLDVLDTFADIGATVADNFGEFKTVYGQSLLSYLK